MCQLLMKEGAVPPAEVAGEEADGKLKESPTCIICFSSSFNHISQPLKCSNCPGRLEVTVPGGAADGVPCGSGGRTGAPERVGWREGQGGQEAPEVHQRGWARGTDGGWHSITKAMLLPPAAVAGPRPPITSSVAPGASVGVWSRFGHFQLMDEEVTTETVLSLSRRG